MTVSKNTGDYIPRKQLAIELGQRLRGKPFNEHTLIGWQRRGEGPKPIKVGRDVCYRVSVVEEWLKSLEAAG